MFLVIFRIFLHILHHLLIMRINESWLHLSLAVQAAVFIIFISLLSFHSRLAIDDFEYIKQVHISGIIGSTVETYHTWSTRWSSTFFGNCFFSLFDATTKPVFFHLITFSALISALLFLVKNIFNVVLKINISDWQVLIYSVSSAAAFFISCWQRGDSWFWVNTCVTYLWNLIALMVAAALIIIPKKNIFHWAVIAVAGIYIGGASEVFTSFLLVTVSLLFAAKYYFRLKIFQKPVLYSILVFSVCILLSFIPVVMGEGRIIRAAALPDVPLAKMGTASLISFAKFSLLKLPSALLPATIFSLPWFYAGLKNPFEKVTLQYIFKKIIPFIILVFVFTVIFFSVVTAVVMGESGPERIWLPVYLILTLFVSALFYLLGSCREISMRIKTPLLAVMMAVPLLFLSAAAVKNISIAKKYAEANDMRMQFLLELKKSNFSGVAELEPLPYHGMLMSNEISTDTNHYSNVLIETGLELPFKVKRK